MVGSYALFRTTVAIAGVVVLAGAVLQVGPFDAQTARLDALLQRLPIVTGQDHLRGTPGADVTIVEYGGFECPFSRRQEGTLQRIRELYGNRVNVVFRHFPLPYHPNGVQEAEAAECVAALAGSDAYWIFHDALFDRPPDLSTLEGLAEAIGVDTAAFRRCLESEEKLSVVRASKQKGIAAGITGTPTMFLINNRTGAVRRMVGAKTLSILQSSIDAILRER